MHLLGDNQRVFHLGILNLSILVWQSRCASLSKQFPVPYINVGLCDASRFRKSAANALTDQRKITFAADYAGGKLK